MKKFFLSTLIIFLVNSCINRNDDDSNLIAKRYIGEYIPLSINSDYAIDANSDGVYNTNLFEEFSLILSKTPIRIWDSKENTLYCDALIGYMSKPPITYPSDYTEVLINPTGAYLSKKDFKILKTAPILNRDGTVSETKIIDFKIIDNNTIQLKFNNNLIYDESTKEWKTIKIDAVYKKN